MTWNTVLGWGAIIIGAMIVASILVFCALMWRAWNERPPRHTDPNRVTPTPKPLVFKWYFRNRGKGGDR